MYAVDVCSAFRALIAGWNYLHRVDRPIDIFTLPRYIFLLPPTYANSGPPLGDPRLARRGYFLRMLHVSNFYSKYNGHLIRDLFVRPIFIHF
jgi:hypothetical protein